LYIGFLINLINMLYNMSNKKTFSPKKSAFSLIELSIVLIIIGLLIAGITGGASLVSSSTLRAVMGEARGYAVGVNSFYGQFNALPGDYNGTLGTSNVLSATSNTGNASGYIEYNPSGGASPEGTLALQHLIGTKIIDPTSLFPNSSTVGSMTYSTTASAALVPGTHLPISKSKGSGWAFDTVTVNSIPTNVVALTSTTASGAAGNGLVSGGTIVGTGALVPSDALSIDTKLDDGKPGFGRVTAYNGNGAAGNCITSTTVYTVAQTTKNCVLAYQIDPNI
jgi:prepilin-type N-terminal cleavage/methylation domain-containing protein